MTHAEWLLLGCTNDDTRRAYDCFTRGLFHDFVVSHNGHFVTGRMGHGSINLVHIAFDPNGNAAIIAVTLRMIT